MKIDSSHAISRRRDNVACCCLRACWRFVSVPSFVLTFSPVLLRLARKLRDGSVGAFMYFHLLYSPKFFSVVSATKSTRMLLRRPTELMDLMDHVFVGSPASPPFAFHQCPFHMSTSLPLEKAALRGVFWGTHGCENSKSK